MNERVSLHSDFFSKIAFSNFDFYAKELDEQLTDQVKKELLPLLDYNPNPDILEYPVRVALTIYRLPAYPDSNVLKLQEYKEELLGDILPTLMSILEKNYLAVENQIIFLRTIFPPNCFKSEGKNQQPDLVNENMELTPFHQAWFLCSASERRMLLALLQGDVIVVNNCLVVKFIGKLAGYCMADIEASNKKQFLSGVWYSPSPDTQKKIKEEFRQGKRFIQMDWGDWILMRPAKSENSAVRKFSNIQLLEKVSSPDHFEQVLASGSYGQILKRVRTMFISRYFKSFHQLVTESVKYLNEQMPANQKLNFYEERFRYEHHQLD